MLTLDDGQIDAFEERLFDAMHQRIERAIAATFPEFCGKPAAGAADGAAAVSGQIEAIVERGIENAVRYDIDDGPDFAAFIALGLALRLAPPGPSADWITLYVNRPDTAGQTKLRMIESRLRALAEEDRAFALIAQRVAQARERATA